MAYDDSEGTFEATERFKVDGSSLVEEAAYDADSKELLLFFRSGSGYLYSEVPAELFENFRNAHSKGQFYNNWIKRGDSVVANGEVFWDTEIVDKTVTVPAADMGSVTGTGPIIHFHPNSSLYTLTTLPTTTINSLPARVTRAHRIDFTVDGGNEVKSYTVDAVGVDEATNALIPLVHALGLTLRIKGVYVDFE